MSDSQQTIIYVDNNATTAVDAEVLAACMPYLTTWYGNPSSPHSFGEAARRAVERAREQVAALVGCEPGEILFTSGGTESDNAAILSALDADYRRRRIVTTAVEHPAVLSLTKVLQQRGYHIEYARVDARGRLDLHQFRDLITDDTAIVSVMWANNETGNVYPVEAIADLAHARGALFHTDAVQAVGKLPVALRGGQLDFLSLSGHKLHAPKGVGALYVRRGVRFTPLVIGGHQERGLRAGTENVAGIVALGAAAEKAGRCFAEECGRVAALRDELERRVLATCPDAIVNGDPAHRLPNTTNVSFKYIEGESILMLLNQFGICASSGSACTSGSLEPSHVLRAMGVPQVAIHGSIRFSLSRFTTRAEIEEILKQLPPVVRRLRDISPYGRVG